MRKLPCLGISFDLGGGLGYVAGMTINTGNKIGLTIYAELAKRIRRSIQDGEFASGQLIGSEYALARQENISRMTVRRASELLVKEGLLERRPGKGLYVREGAGGRGVVVERAQRTVQVIAGNLAWEPSVQISRSAGTVAKGLGVGVQLYDAHGDVAMDVAMLRELPGSGVSGALILSLHNSAFSEAVYQLKVSKFPFVLVDQCLRDLDVSSVTADNYGGGYMAGKMLVELGHRRIGALGDLVATTVRDRFAGLRDAICDAGLSFDRSLTLDLQAEQDRLGDWSGRVGEGVKELMSRPAPPTAFFASCDAVARAMYRTLAQLGLRIPQDLSVIGFDDDPLAEWLEPGLTTIRQPFAEMGRVAMEMLCRHMDASAHPVTRKVLAVELIVRGSTGPARQAAPGSLS